MSKTGITGACCILPAYMNRIDRITAILIQLQSRKVVKAQHIADRFNISLRTVYRDISTLEEAGIPIIGEAGVGYSIMDGYRLPPVIFTKEEATAFLTAEKFMEKLTDAATKENYRSAMYKIRSVLRSTEKDLLENIENHIEVLTNYLPFETSTVSNVLEPLLKGIADKETIRIQYKAATNEVSERIIEPIGVFYATGYWHLIAYCRLRNDYRDFRADRISRLLSTGEHVSRNHPTLQEYLAQTKQHPDLQPAVLRFHNSMVKYLSGMRHSFGFLSEKQDGDYTEMTFLAASLEGIARWFLMFGDNAEIVSPETLKTRVIDLIHTIGKRQGKNK